MHSLECTTVHSPILFFSTSVCLSRIKKPRVALAANSENSLWEFIFPIDEPAFGVQKWVFFCLEVKKEPKISVDFAALILPQRQRTRFSFLSPDNLVECDDDTH